MAQTAKKIPKMAQTAKKMPKMAQTAKKIPKKVPKMASYLLTPPRASPPTQAPRPPKGSAVLWHHTTSGQANSCHATSLRHAWRLWPTSSIYYEIHYYAWPRERLPRPCERLPTCLCKLSSMHALHAARCLLSILSGNVAMSAPVNGCSALVNNSAPCTLLQGIPTAKGQAHCIIVCP